MNHRIIDTLDLSFYPLHGEMTTDEIKVVKREDIVKAGMVIVGEIAKTYEGTSYWVDDKLAFKLLTFISLLRHTGGDLGGVEFRLLPFQIEYLTQTLCVLNKSDDSRKHTESILFIPRKAGKSELTAAITLWMFFMDKEKQKEIYSIASETTQAAIIYQATIQMLRGMPSLMKRVQIFKAEKKIQSTTGEFVDLYRVLSAVASTKDGLKTSVTISDEAAAYPDSALYDVVVEGSAHRKQGLAILVTTAGYLKMGFFHRKLLYARQVMDGIIEDPTVYLMDYCVPEDADWEDEELWKAANPALNFGVTLKYLRAKFNKAQHSASEEVSFRTKHINQFTDSAVTWIKSQDWNASHTREFNEEDLIGRECFAGLDLSSTTDITAFVLVFPWDDGTGYDVITRSFIPKDTAKVRSKEDKVSYLDWAKSGYITLTEGNIIDYEDLYYHIMGDVEKFAIKEISFDRWNSTSLITKLMQEGVECVAVGQGFKTISPAVKAVESLVLTKKLNHDNNPILAWAISNVALETDAAENYKLSKEKAIERIDPAVALCMAVIRAESFREAEVDWTSLIG